MTYFRIVSNLAVFNVEKNLDFYFEMAIQSHSEA